MNPRNTYLASSWGAVLGAALLLLPGPVRALTLEEALAAALRSSPELAAARADAEAAGMSADGASRGRWPSLHVGLEGARSDDPVFVFGSKLRQERFAADDFGSIDMGTGTIDLSPLNAPDPVTNLRASAMLRQTIWSGGEVTGRLRAARGDAAAAAAGLEATRQEILFRTEAAYRGAVLAEERLDLLRESLAVARGHAERVTELHAEGLALEADRQALLVQVGEIRAELASAAADSAAARSRLALLMGETEPVGEALLEPSAPEGPPPTLDEARTAADERASVRVAEARVESAAGSAKAAGAALLPAIDLYAGAEHNTDHHFDESGNQWLVGAGLRWRFDLGSPARSGSAGRAERAAQERVVAARRLARYEVEAAHGRWLASVERERALAAAVEAGRESFRLVEERHREGLATTLELTESQNTLTRIALRHAEAHQQTALARRELERAAGLLAPSAEIGS